MSQSVIRLRGVAVNNLRRINLDLPHRRLIAICGVSGSGKTSLALDTLYAEGQRRYIESFSAYTRQFLEQLDKPEAELIDGIPPAIAVTHSNPTRSNRATVGTSTEINDYLSLLFARVGEVICPTCNRPCDATRPKAPPKTSPNCPPAPDSCSASSSTVPTDEPLDTWLADLVEQGYVRAVIGNRTESLAPTLAKQVTPGDELTIILDRLTTGSTPPERLRESIETAFAAGDGSCVIFDRRRQPAPSKSTIDPGVAAPSARSLRCETCGLDFPDPEPQLFNFNRPLGACPECEGFGNIVATDMDRVVPDKSKSIRDGAIAPWNTAAYAHELEELLALADDYNLPVDVPFSQLTERQLKIIQEGVPERNFGGLNGFFRWLERRKYKMHLRVFLSRWRSYYPCPSCGGARLRPEALAVHVAGKNFADVSRLEIRDALTFLERSCTSRRGNSPSPTRCSTTSAPASPSSSTSASATSRSTAPSARSAAAKRSASPSPRRSAPASSTCSTSSTNPRSASTRPTSSRSPPPSSASATAATRSSSSSTKKKSSAAPTKSSSSAPTPATTAAASSSTAHRKPCEQFPESRTGDWLAGRRRLGGNTRRPTDHGWVKLTGARGNNLQNVTVEFPLGVLCLVTGVSGAGKSTLVEQTLYPALARPLHKEKDRDNGKAAAKSSAKPPLPFDEVFGSGQLEDVILIDQRPIGRSPRSNPLTSIKAFDLVRKLFAEADRRPRPQLHRQRLQLQRRRRPLRNLPRRRLSRDRHAVHGRRLHALPRVRRPPLSPRDPRSQIPRPQHRRSAQHDGPRSLHLLPRPPQAAVAS